MKVELCLLDSFSALNKKDLSICVSQCLILQQTGGVSLPLVSRWRECPPLKSLFQTWLSRSL